jgi:hypothetical protein
MVLQGSCCCGNITLSWDANATLLVPRACQCSYCVSRQAAWVGQTGTSFHVTIHRPEHHRIITQGSRTARFHECTSCNTVVFATALLEREHYGILNAHCLQQYPDLAAPVQTDFSTQDPERKRSRWRRNWCHPVAIEYGALERNLT